MLELIIGAASGLAGVMLGWFGSYWTSPRLLVIGESRAAARALVDAIVTARLDVMPDAYVFRPPARDAIQRGHGGLSRATLRYNGLLPADLAERTQPLPYLLILLTSDDAERRGPDVTYVVERGFVDVLAALDAHLLGKPLPPRSFPTVDELRDAAEQASHNAKEATLVREVRAAVDRYPAPPPRGGRMIHPPAS